MSSFDWKKVPCRDIAHRARDLRIARTERGAKLLAPPSEVVHLDLQAIESLRRTLRELADELVGEKRTIDMPLPRGSIEA